MISNIITNKIKDSESFLVANDGQYLGKLSLNRYDSDSIYNIYGLYGNQYSSTSIFNPYSIYGNSYSALSPFNPYTSTPPAIYLKGMFYGYLSKNPYLGPNTLDPHGLQLWVIQNNLNF
jgi:hypothetical protein